MSAPRSEYQNVMYERAIELGVNIRLGCKIESINQFAPSLKLDGGEVVKADLIIGADGMDDRPSSCVNFPHLTYESRCTVQDPRSGAR